MTASHREQLNKIADAQWKWAPLRKVRPKMDEPMPVRAIFWTAIAFSSAFVIAKAAGASIFGTELYTPRLASMLVAYSLVSYLCYSLMFARAGNDRARELAARPRNARQDAE